MDNVARRRAGVLIVASIAAHAVTAARAQTAAEPLPQITVTSSRIGSGVAGTSTTIITSEDIERSPGQTLQDVLSQQPGIQVQNLFGNVNGAQTNVDLRGFGATGPSNTLVLINGRRITDIDIAGVDFSTIPRQSIDHIEIIRGNSGAVLYGDGAVGGVINIVTKTGAGLPNSAHVDASAGSYRYQESNASVLRSFGNFSASGYGTVIGTDGYRDNNRLRERTGVGDVRYTGTDGTAYFTVSGDDQRLGLPGGRLVTPTSSLLATDPRGAATPFDFANKQGINATAGFTRNLDGGAELIVDGGIRHKQQQAAFFSAFGSDFDNYVDSVLTTLSLTPRLTIANTMFGIPSKIITGVDVYDSIYGSDREQDSGNAPFHRYNLNQLSVAGYYQQTLSIWPTTDVAFGGRVQGNSISARDRYDPNAPGGAFATVQGDPLDKTEGNYALHLGIEHRVTDYFALFGRVARSFRVPNVDERVGQGPFAQPTTFDLKTQTSHDIEGGVRINWDRFTLQSSVYDIELNNEIFFSPATFTNINLDPTRRYGVENLATYQLTETVRLKGSLAYTRAVFREGPFAGNDVPLVSRWTGSAGVSWDVWQKWVVFDAVARFTGARRFDNDSANFQPLIPEHTIVDLRVGGQIEHVNWSVSVQNLFDTPYFDYGIASAFTYGTYNAYPLPGRTVIGKLGVTF